MAAGNSDLNRGCNFLTLGFERNQREIWGNFEYQSCREFHKLSKESRNSEFRCRTRDHEGLKLEGFSRYGFELI